jgi:type III secretion protein V
LELTVRTLLERLLRSRPNSDGSAFGVQLADWMAMLTRRGDLAVVLLMAAVVSLFVLPVPPLVLDALIAVNIAASVLMLMMSVYVPSPTTLTTFPALLLFTTLLRLSLNIASTKQILLHAHAGDIIESFGRLVVGGSALVGGVVFVIIAIVQFLVIAKGSERVAEVGARFTLDGMPGKQMSIDADLRAGLISKEEARQRREELEHESQWHGAMDGAMKFVKGDAIAGLVIAFVNIVAGIAVGVAIKQMAMAEAVHRYTVLTVGDGMVSQIPSLFASVAAGVLITRVASVRDRRTNLGRQLAAQVLGMPMAILMSAALVLSLLVVPGFPKLVILTLGVVLAVVGWAAWQHDSRHDAPEAQPVPAMRGDAERVVPLLIQTRIERDSAPIQVRLSPKLQLALTAKGFDSALAMQRERLYDDIGLPFPGVRIRYDKNLPDNNYLIDAQDIPVAQGTLEPHAVWVHDSQGERWLPLPDKNARRRLSEPRPPVPVGKMADEVLAMHIGQVISSRADLFLGIQDVQRIVEDIARNQPELAQEITRAVPLQRIAEVMKNLVRESISLRNTRQILESLILWVPREKDVTLLTEHVRNDLGAMTVARLARGRTELPVIMLSQASENAMRESIQETMAGAFLALGPQRSERLLSQATSLQEQARAQDQQAVFACSMDLRRYFKRAVEAALPDVPVLSYQEIGNHITVVAVGSIEIEAQVALT